MKDVKGKEITIGANVAFTVGTEIKTGKVVRIKTKPNLWEGIREGMPLYQEVRISLDVPEQRYSYINGRYEVDPKKVRLTRDVSDSSRLIVLGS